MTTRLFRVVLFLLLSSSVCGLASAQSTRFLESGGIVVMDVESVPATGEWAFDNSIPGFKGSGYYVWRGPDLFNPASAGQGTVQYHFRIQTAGNYQMRWRSRITHGNNGSESNDSWIRFPTGQNINGEHGLNGWTKVYMGHLNTWSWDSYTVDHVGKQILQYFSAGDHVVEISGRSFGHALDRISLFRYADVEFTAGFFDTLEQSSSVGSQPAPQPIAEPAPQPEPEPQPEPSPPVEPVAVEDNPLTGPLAPVDLRAEVYSPTASELFWQPGGGDTSTVSYEVLRDGQPLAVTDGRSYFDSALDAGTSYTYSVVAIDGSGLASEASAVTLETPAAPESALTDATSQESNPQQSNPQQSNDGSDSSVSSPSGLISGVRVAVYSETAAEIIWDRDESGAWDYEISVNGEVQGRTTGNSYFLDSLLAGTEYEFSVRVISTFTGEGYGGVALTATTPGALSAATASADVPAPENVRIAIYSTTACELFWDAPAADIVATDVLRDGLLIASVPGNSFFDADCVEGTNHQYELVAIAASGQTSASVMVNQ